MRNLNRRKGNRNKRNSFYPTSVERSDALPPEKKNFLDIGSERLIIVELGLVEVSSRVSAAIWSQKSSDESDSGLGSSITTAAIDFNDAGVSFPVDRVARGFDTGGAEDRVG